MHELYAAQSILERALEEAAKQAASRVAVIYVKLGPGGHIARERLEFCLQAAAKGTIAEDARVQVESGEGEGVYLTDLDVD